MVWYTQSKGAISHGVDRICRCFVFDEFLDRHPAFVRLFADFAISFATLAYCRRCRNAGIIRGFDVSAANLVFVWNLRKRCNLCPCRSPCSGKARDAGVYQGMDGVLAGNADGRRRGLGNGVAWGVGFFTSCGGRGRMVYRPAVSGASFGDCRHLSAFVAGEPYGGENLRTGRTNFAADGDGAGNIRHTANFFGYRMQLMHTGHRGRRRSYASQYSAENMGNADFFSDHAHSDRKPKHTGILSRIGCLR